MSASVGDDGFQYPHRKPFSLTHVIYDEDDPLGPVLALLSLAPAFCVASVVLYTAVVRDLRGAFLLSGQLGTSCLCIVLKKIVRQPRPPFSPEPDVGGNDGMPSNHAAFVSFCAVFSLCFAITQYNNRRGTTTTTALARWTKRWLPPAGAFVIAAGCSYSRVHLGYHTPVQVLAGTAVGSLVGILYAYLYNKDGGAYRQTIVPAIERSWLGTQFDVRSYHDVGGGDGDEYAAEDLAGFVARHLDEHRSRRKNSKKQN